MPIQLPDLDNKTFDDLMKEMIASIPKYTKEWTNFNPSDPGITILELLAWISEALIYRINIVPEESYVNFLKLVAGDTVYDETDTAHKKILEYLKGIAQGKVRKDIQSMKAEAQKFLNSRYRAITEDDFKELALEACSEIKKTDETFPEIKRAKVFVSSSKVDVVIILEYKDLPENEKIIIEPVKKYLEPRRLIGTIVEVKLAEYTKINLKITIACKSYAQPETVKASVREAVNTYFDSIKGGPEGKGWPYRRNLMVYELFHVIERIDGVKYVSEVSAKSESENPLQFPVEIKGLIYFLEPIAVEIKEESNE